MQSESAAAPAKPPTILPRPIKDALGKARVSWLKNTEVAQLLSCHRALGFEVSQEAPERPQSGSLFLFNRKTLRFFRKDGHSWRKKADGKTVRETHEKLKVGSKDMLNCYYAHSDQEDGLQRRCYWLLDGDDGTVLVHYLAGKKLGRAHSDPRCQSEPMLPYFWDTARVAEPDAHEPLPYSTNKLQRSYQGGLQDTCMNFEQGPVITTAPDLDRACASSLLPPLPSSSKSRHPRAMLTIPSSSAGPRQQHSTSMMGRPHAIVSGLDAFMQRADRTPISRSPAMLSTPDVPSQPPSHALHGSYGLRINEQPVAFDQSVAEAALTHPNSLHTRHDSLLSRYDSGLTGSGIGLELEGGYIPRQAPQPTQHEGPDESRQAMDAMRNSLLLQGKVMGHNRTASAPSMPNQPGTQMPAGFESHTGLVTPHRRQHSDGVSQAFARSLQPGLAESFMTGLQQPSSGGRQYIEASMQGLHQAAFTGQGLQHTALSEQELQQSVAGHSLQQAAIVQQGLNQSALTGHNQMHTFSPRTPMPQHDSLAWDSTAPSPMMQDDTPVMHDNMTDHHMVQPRHVTPTGEMNEETLSTRASFFKQDAQSGRGTLQWPLPSRDSESHPAYSPWPAQAPARPQSGLQTHSQVPADFLDQPGFQSGFQAKSQLGLPSQSGYGSGFGSGLQTPTHSHSQSQLKSLADSYATKQAQGQAEALEYLRRSTLTQTLPQTWQTSWPSSPQLPDLEASMELDAQPTTQSDCEAAFFSWMQARRSHGIDLHCTV